MKGEMMKIKRRLLSILCGLLIISLGILTPVYADGESNNAKTETTVFKKKAEKEKKKVKNKKNKENKKNKKNKNKKAKKIRNKKKKNNKKDKNKKNKNEKDNKNIADMNEAKNKETNQDEKNINITEKQETEKLPATDEYRPELYQSVGEVPGRSTGEWSYYPNITSEERPSTDYVLLCEQTDKRGKLKFKAGESIALPEKGHVGLKLTGENTGKEFEVVWTGSSMELVKKGVKGSYTLTVQVKENVVIGEKDYGRVKFAVDIIVE